MRLLLIAAAALAVAAPSAQAGFHVASPPVAHVENIPGEDQPSGNWDWGDDGGSISQVPVFTPWDDPYVGHVPGGDGSAYPPQIEPGDYIPAPVDECFGIFVWACGW